MTSWRSRQTDMRIVWVLLSACLSSASLHAQEAGGISSSVLSRCAGKAGGEVRQGDPAFVALGLDGRPWMTVERTESAVGSQPISTTVTGTRVSLELASERAIACRINEEGPEELLHK